jgi:hypothetical protein
MSLLFVPRETEPGETRVAATPETTKGYLKLGFEVVIETQAGLASGYRDEEFVAAGARIGDLIAEADVVLTVRVPKPEHVARMKRGAVLVSGLVPAMQLDAVKSLRDAGVTSFGMELVPRITRAQKMDVLSSQATCAGYQAVLLAAAALPRFFPLLMTAAGTVKPMRLCEARVHGSCGHGVSCSRAHGVFRMRKNNPKFMVNRKKFWEIQWWERLMMVGGFGSSCQFINSWTKSTKSHKIQQIARKIWGYFCGDFRIGTKSNKIRLEYEG